VTIIAQIMVLSGIELSHILLDLWHSSSERS